MIGINSARNAASAALIAAMSLFSPGAGAQYPEKPVRMVVGFAPGGPSDIVARIIAPAMSRQLGQQIIIDNKPGASGTIATEAVVKAPADGYTLLLGSESDFAVAPVLFRKLTYDPVKDLSPVAAVASFFNVLVVNPSAGFRNLQDFIDRAKAAPGKVVYASGGSGTPSHLFGALFGLAAGVDLLHISYKGAGPALTDLIGGHVQAMFLGGPAAVSQVKSGKLKALAVTGSSRASQLPDVPTFGEGGTKSPELEQSFWWVLAGPAGLDPQVVGRLAAALGTALRQSDTQAQFANQGLSPRFDDAQTARGMIEKDRRKWARVIKAAGITLE